jgi:hypothetical protein
LRRRLCSKNQPQQQCTGLGVDVHSSP